MATIMAKSPEDLEAFARWVTDRAHERGYTQLSLANALGASLSTVTGWYQGRTLPSYSQLKHLRALLGALPFEDEG